MKIPVAIAKSSSRAWSPPRATALAASVIALTALAAYWNSFHAAFVYDDRLSIAENATIHQLWPIWRPLMPPANSGLPVDGRPLVNLSLALNYAISGTRVFGYHVVNLTIHILAGLALFGIVRRTLNLPPLRARFGTAAFPLAWTTALLWIAHPLQTEAVTYVVQRAESLMGLFYLLTLYCFIRGAAEESAETASRGQNRSRTWLSLAAIACLLGMATKEVMATAPLIVLLYDRTFVAGTFRGALKQRRILYSALASTWLLLAWLVFNAGSRGGTAGFEAIVTPWSYALTQCRAIVLYVRLCAWPHPLVFDYGLDFVASATQVVPQILAVSLLVGAIALAVWRLPAIGFLGAWFFAILAPTSSVVPVITEPLAEHRLYLSLASIVAGAVLGGYALLGRRSLYVFGALVVASGILTSRRNSDYRSETALWGDTVAKQPDNARAHFNLGEALARDGKGVDAITEYERAVELKPAFASAHSNLADALLKVGRAPEARAHAEAALRINPRLAEAHATLANALYTEGEVVASLPHYEEAVQLEPASATLRNNLGAALSRLDRLPEALAQYEESRRLDSANADTPFFLGNTLARLGRFTQAADCYEDALRLRPDFTRAKENLDRVRALAAGAEQISRESNPSGHAK